MEVNMRLLVFDILRQRMVGCKERGHAVRVMLWKHL